MKIEEHIEKVLKPHVSSSITLESPPDPAFGDYAFPCFQLAKEKRKAPPLIAQELAALIKPDSYISKIEAKGPYVNFFVNALFITKQILHELHRDEEKYGSKSTKKNDSAHETIMVEFSSPNTNKPLHLGHIRNITLGESLSRILSFAGNSVIRSCVVNDRGVHICKSMLAYERYGANKTPQSEQIKGDFFVGSYYVLYSKEAEKNPKLNDEVQAMLKAWEDSDPKIRALWKKMNTWVYEGFDETYKKLGIQFDKTYYESDLYDKGKEIVTHGFEKGVFVKEENGAISAPLEPFGIPNKILVRSDGTTIYITQDIYLAVKKVQDFGLDRSLYVVGSEQNLHFKQLFKILELLEYPWAKECTHISYGMVYLPEGRMKSREGTIVDADDLIKEMSDLAYAEITKRHPELPKEELDSRSMLVGLAALKFFMLKLDPQKDMTYDPKESISFEGETGPYIQYTHARICSILRKYADAIPQTIDYGIYDELEQQLIKKIGKFPDVVLDAAHHYKPSLICHYLLEVSQACNEFYHASPILKAEEKTMLARLVLIDAVRVVLRNGLHLLGITAIEEM